MTSCENCVRSNTIITFPFQRNNKSLFSTCSNASSIKLVPEQTSPLKPLISDGLVWMDLEMTGLVVEKDTILELACVITDFDMNILHMGPNLVVHHPENVLRRMNEWSQKQHNMSGLIDAVRNSGIHLLQAESQILEFLETHTIKGKLFLAGNSIQTDKRFLEKHMPRLHSHFHYRVVDVSTLRELCKRWFPEMFSNAPLKSGNHRALEDILESMEELKYYRFNIFRDGSLMKDFPNSPSNTNAFLLPSPSLLSTAAAAAAATTTTTTTTTSSTQFNERDN